MRSKPTHPDLNYKTYCQIIPTCLFRKYSKNQTLRKPGSSKHPKYPNKTIMHILSLNTSKEQHHLKTGSKIKKILLEPKIVQIVYDVLIPNYPLILEPHLPLLPQIAK